jgi:hypothetical protein
MQAGNRNTAVGALMTQAVGSEKPAIGICRNEYNTGAKIPF